jgi:hypothetical protein
VVADSLARRSPPQSIPPLTDTTAPDNVETREALTVVIGEMWNEPAAGEL